MSKNLKVVLFFTVAVAVAVTGYVYNEHKNSVKTLENTPAVVDNVVPVVEEVSTEVVATPAVEIKAEAVPVATPAVEVKKEAVPVATPQTTNTKNKK